MRLRLRPLLFRLASTLVVAPPLFLAAILYVRVATLGGEPDFWRAAAKELGRIYLETTLPALALVLILLPLDWLLQRIDFGLTTIALSPLVAALLVFGLGDVIREPHVQTAAAALPLFVTYGLVWGLTIRDPATWRSRPGQS